MPNSIEHSIGGGIGAFLINYFIQKRTSGQIDLKKALAYGLVGGSIGLLPDILELADNPNHRGFCHNIVAGIGLIWLINNIRNNPNISAEAKEFLISMIMAYGSHLVLDAQTPKSLPLY